jgi:peptidoglycan hydrolase CwlO-like protein
MECALLDGEQQSETTELMKEKEILDHLNRKIAELEKNIVGEKTKVKKKIYIYIYINVIFMSKTVVSQLFEFKC